MDIIHKLLKAVSNSGLRTQGSLSAVVAFSVSGTSIVFDMSLTYILVALLAVILNNVLVERLSLHTRITVGESEMISNITTETVSLRESLQGYS